MSIAASISAWQARGGSRKTAMPAYRRKHNRIGKVEVQRHQASPFPATHLNEMPVSSTLQMLLRNSGNIVTGPTQALSPTIAEILIELDSRRAAHHASST